MHTDINLGAMGRLQCVCKVLLSRGVYRGATHALITEAGLFAYLST